MRAPIRRIRPRRFARRTRRPRARARRARRSPERRPRSRRAGSRDSGAGARRTRRGRPARARRRRRARVRSRSGHGARAEHPGLQLAAAVGVRRRLVTVRHARVDDDERRSLRHRHEPVLERPGVDQHGVPWAAEQRRRLVEDPDRDADRARLRALACQRELEWLELAGREIRGHPGREPDRRPAELGELGRQLLRVPRAAPRRARSRPARARPAPRSRTGSRRAGRARRCSPCARRSG